MPSASRTSTYGVASSRRRPPAGGQPLRQSADRLVVGEPHLRALQPGTPVDVDVVGTVDEHVGDTRHPDQRVEEPSADDVAAQRLVNRQDRRVPHRPPLLPQGRRHPRGGEATLLPAQPRPDRIDDARGQCAHAAAPRHPAACRPARRAPRRPRARAGRGASAPARGRGRSPRPDPAAPPSSRPGRRPVACSTSRTGTPWPRTSSRVGPDRSAARATARSRRPRPPSAWSPRPAGRTGRPPP